MKNIVGEKWPSTIKLRLFSQQIIVIKTMESFILAGTALILEKDIKKDQENSAHNYTDSSNSHDSIF